MTEMMCCPLSECDDAPTVYTTTTPVARKPHRCEECGESIVVGTRYELYKSLFDGTWSTTRTCSSCAEIRDHFRCGGSYYIGMLWEELEENFFPDMRAGGPCMDGLSPTAKGRLFEMRLEWVFAQREWQPERFALPPGYAQQDAVAVDAGCGTPYESPTTTYELARAALRPPGDGWND